MSKEYEIRSELRRLEQEKNIHIVNARERGSRMLGAEHEDSDWDVMFLFAQDAGDYATIHGHIDSIHEPHVGQSEEIDLHGWNIDKFGELVLDSNPNAVEYCRANPTEYISAGKTFDRLASNVRHSFNHMSLYHHYISMAKRNWKKYIDSDNDCTKGRQFYVARSVAMAQGIRRGGGMPPLDARELADYEPIDEDIRRVLAKLTEAKRSGHGEQENEDIVGELYERESDAPMNPTDERINRPDTGYIDNFIREKVVR
jgi:predicted nucleotidyltransferase